MIIFIKLLNKLKLLVHFKDNLYKFLDEAKKNFHE